MQHYAERGRRVLMLARRPDGLTGETLPERSCPSPSWCSRRRSATSAPDTIKYFEDQGVTVKVISGDNPVTVAAVAQRVGVAGADRPSTPATLPDDEDQLADVLDEYAVFGRVTPHQKRAMVHALQATATWSP